MSSSLGFTAALLGAIVMGMTCGAGCSPAIGMILGNYVVQADGEKKKVIAAFSEFYWGKAAAVMSVCIVAAAAGRRIVEAGEYFGGYHMDFIMPAFLALSGGYIFVQCIWKRKKSCSNCKSCGKGKEQTMGVSPLIAGFLYGLTPCPPLVILAGYAVAMSWAKVAVLVLAFSIACTVPSFVMILVFTKLIVVKMKQEVPALLEIMKYVMSAGVAGIGVYLLFTGGAIR